MTILDLRHPFFPSAQNLIRVGGVLVLSLSLWACSSGSGKTGQVKPPPPEPVDPGAVKVYTGPSPDTRDVQNFKISVWDTLAQPGYCGNCHGIAGQEPLFVRDDDINLAYAAVNPWIDLKDPVASPLVTKVGSGHNCWGDSTAGCVEQLTTWISNWARESGVVLTEAALRQPESIPVGPSLSYPVDTAAFQQHVYPLLRQHCADCHRADAPQAPVQPYLASSDIAQAYAAAQTKITINVLEDGERDASGARLVVRLKEESHNCWDNNCQVSANAMEQALEAFAHHMALRPLDASLIVSDALTIADGTAISQGGRVESNAIALYTFKEGKGRQAQDSSVGFPPQMTLNLLGDVQWVSNWGIRFNGGRAQATVESSRKLQRYLTQTGEYSVEAWLVPANVTQEGPARIISYSGSDTLRNFTLGQTGYQYDFLNRSSTTSSNGVPALSTPDGAQVLQATLQHVVASYDAISGRRLYVNGELVQVQDAIGPGHINAWDRTFALALGSEVSGQYPWQGTIRLLAIHNRALTSEQVENNYSVGVGQKILLAFSVSHLIEGMDDAYIVFQVEQFDDYSYLFTEPYFYSFAETPPRDIRIRGLRIGVNGREARIGQTFANLDITVPAQDFPDIGVPLVTGKLGAVIEAEKGPEQDQFFLSFDLIDNRSRERVEDEVPAPVIAEDLPPQPRIGVRLFAEVNASLSAMTGIPVTEPAVAATYEAVKQQMPPTEQIDSFLVAHQMGITQLAVKYCNVLAIDSQRMNAFFPNFSANRFDADGRAALIEPLLQTLLAHPITSLNASLGDQPLPSDSRDRLNALIDTMTASCQNQVCSPAVTRNTVTAVCAAALGSAVMLVQ